MKHLFYILCAVLLVFQSCGEKDEEIVMGMAPVYVDSEDESLVYSSDPQAFEKLGTISERGSFIYINEINEGIHVLDNTNPSNPVNLVFWKIPGCTIFTVDGDRLYADNGINLWTIDISDIYNIKVIDIEKDIFTDQTNNIKHRPPEPYEGQFECVVPEKGVPVYWIEKEIISPKCRTI